MRRKNFNLKAGRIVLPLLLAVISILFISASYGFNVSKYIKNINMNITEKEQSYVGINYDDIYNITDAEDAIQITITNNLPNRTSYVLNLSGIPINDYSPGNFTLNPGESKIIELYILSDEEFLNIDYIIDGDIRADFSKGTSKVEFSFRVTVEADSIYPQTNG